MEDNHKQRNNKGQAERKRTEQTSRKDEKILNHHRGNRLGQLYHHRRIDSIDYPFASVPPTHTTEEISALTCPNRHDELAWRSSTAAAFLCLSRLIELNRWQNEVRVLRILF